jgi:hypothetical protein
MWVELDGYSKHPHFDSLRGTWEAGDGQLAILIIADSDSDLMPDACSEGWRTP